MARQEQDREYTARIRALETPSERITRLDQVRAYTVRKRAKHLCIDDAIARFQLQTKMGPDYVCTVCHRMMYKQNVIPCSTTKYTKASDELLEQTFCPEHSYISSDGKQWLCRTCDSALTRGNMPVQAKANHLQLDPIPDELSTLNALELRLISLRVPFMKIVALPSGKQRSIHGPAVNVPSKLDSCAPQVAYPIRTSSIQIETKIEVQRTLHVLLCLPRKAYQCIKMA